MGKKRDTRKNIRSRSKRRYSRKNIKSRSKRRDTKKNVRSRSKRRYSRKNIKSKSKRRSSKSIRGGYNYQQGGWPWDREALIQARLVTSSALREAEYERKLRRDLQRELDKCLNPDPLRMSDVSYDGSVMPSAPPPYAPMFQN